MTMKCIEVLALEYVEGGHTLWVHGKRGTVLRIKTANGKIRVKADCQNTYPHADIMTTGDIEICVPPSTTVGRIEG